MGKYKCVIFDCDGVLVDSEPISNGVIVDMANELGANIDLNYALKHFKGGSLYSCIDIIATLIKRPIPDTFECDYRTRSYEAFRMHIKPVEGIPQLLDDIQLPFCVASSGPQEKIKLNLSLTGLLDKFDGHIFSCYDIKKWKPHPDIFLMAAQAMGFEPKECVVIEDSLSGILAALNGGFDVFGFTAHDYHEELKKFATLVFNDMKDLNAILNIS